MSFCSYYDQSTCRSCGWLERPYEAQLAEKERVLRERLALGAPGGVELEPAARSALTGFRNRAKLAVTGTRERPVIGLLGAEGRLDQGRELLQCPIHHPKLNEVLTELPAWLATTGIGPYEIRSRQGELKGLIAFYSPDSREMYLRFVLRSRESIARLSGALGALRARHPELVCVTANIQPIPHAILEGPEEILLTERGSIEHRLGQVSLRLEPRAFVQTNAQVARELYETAARWTAEERPARLLDLFCGQGAFGLFAARAGAARSVLGIEINPSAVAAAQASARQLGLEGVARFESADAGLVEPRIRDFGPDLAVVNPPRRGLGPDTVAALKRSGPRSLLYSSCSIDSLAEDLRALAPEYPGVRRARLFDLFPHTAHFETLVWLQRSRG